MIAIAFGWGVRLASIDGAARIEWLPGCRPFAERAVVALAGDAAEAWSRRWTITEQDASLLETIARVRGLAAGGCDRCVAVRGLIVAAGNAADAAVILRFRQLERFTIEAVRTRSFWPAIEAVAGALMARGSLDGDEVDEICRKFFTPGTLARPPEWSTR